MTKYLLILILPLLLTSCAVEPAIKTVVVYQDKPADVQVGGKKPYIAAERNFDGVQHAELRKKIDWKYNQAHDALSKAYYEETEFVWNGKNYGVLDQDTFNKMQAKIWAEYEVLFHEENKKQKAKDQIPEEEYNDICTEKDGGSGVCTKIEKNRDKAKEKIIDLEKQGIDIKI